MRQIRSFVRREGRLTPGQQRALDNHWPIFGIEDDTDLSDLNALFGRTAPKVIEIGFGNGASLIEMAKNHPDHDYIGIEVHRPGVGQLLKGIDDEQLSNVRVACTMLFNFLNSASKIRLSPVFKFTFLIRGIRSATTNGELSSLSLSMYWQTN